MSSESNIDHRLRNRDLLVLASLVLLSAGGYLLFSTFYYRLGFPLDDAWIHQTYARNLALHDEWSFLPGRPSGGSTAPLWSALLAFGFVIRLAPYAWTYLLGAVALWGICVLGETAVRRLVPIYRPRFPYAGAVLAFEWHLVWAAGSGMETLLYALLVTAVLVQVMLGKYRAVGLGLLIGLAVWVRPDGVTLLGPAVLGLVFGQDGWPKRLRSLLGLAVGFGILVTFYLFFNLLISGSPLPTTFYAKQAEYAAYLQLPFLQRLGSEALQPLIGIGILLLPGAILVLVSSIRERLWGPFLVAVWFVGYLVLYALRLPVTYQHGRYVIPAMPALFLLGLVGLMGLGAVRKDRWRWALAVSWKLVLTLILFLFWARGAYAYAQDVAIIESEMVAAARWVSEKIPADALIAAHDIGALGYFGGHELVDLAGLVSPDIIPYIRDEERLAAYMMEAGVDYIVTFPDWYPFLTADLVPLYTTGAPFAPSQGGTNMAVYAWPIP